MFTDNHIPVTNKELKEHLFQKKNLSEALFKNNDSKSCKDDEIFDFYNIVLLAISDENDQKFRNLMRIIKSKSDKSKSNYLPMSLDLLLDFFNDQGNIRNSVKTIKESTVYNSY